MQGMNIRSVDESEISITLGDHDNDVCNVRTSSDTVSDFYIYNIKKTKTLQQIGDCLQATKQTIRYHISAKSKNISR